MRSFWMATDGAGGSRLESLPLPFQHVGATMTAADLARTPDPSLAGLVRAVRPIRRRDGETTLGGDGGGRRLVVVVAGSLAVAAGESQALLVPGDVLLVDDEASRDHKLTWGGEARAVEIDVEDAWAPSGSVPPAVDGGRGPSGAPRVDRIRVRDDVAHFDPFDTFFPAGSQEVDRFTFTHFSPGLSGDWHTEDRPNLVVVLEGGFELEVGGNGGSRVFGPGDVCLVEDGHGQGHKTRIKGETRILVCALPDGHRWS
ncbi:hypothetical protein GCM10009836_12950 [Pseudonocardia ailaonensis]|uniref:Cupin domain-containing protein n=1 Tax=Pseudonocardia ailaonensis TaxID=367279 RepID=A0ABN2MSL7_9PSEU